MSHLSASLKTVRSRDWKVDLRICENEASECGIREMSRQPKPWIENVTDDFEGNYVSSASSFVFFHLLTLLRSNTSYPYDRLFKDDRKLMVDDRNSQ